MSTAPQTVNILSFPPEFCNYVNALCDLKIKYPKEYSLIHDYANNYITLCEAIIETINIKDE